MPLDAAQRGVARGAAAAAVWTLALFVAGPALVHPVAAPLTLVASWLVLPALTLIAAVGRVANARFFDPAIIHGQDPAAGTPADRARRILRNTTEQCLLAALVWPALAVQLDPARLGIIPALACGFVVGRVAFAAGYARGAAGRAFGFGATFYPTVVAALWATLLLFG